jgi:hypothetical protein
MNYRPEEIEEMRRLYELGKISTAEMDHAESRNALRDVVMPRPRYDLAPLAEGMMRTESGPEAGRTVQLLPTRAGGPSGPSQDSDSAAALRRVFGFSKNGTMSDLGEKREGTPSLDYAKPVEVPGMGKGYQSKDGRAVYVQRDGGWDKVLLGYDRKASMIAEGDQYERELRGANLKKLDMDYQKDEAQLNALKAPKSREAPSGYRWRGDSLEPIPGGPADVSTKAEKPMNDEQAKAAGYGTRAAEAHEILDTIGRGGEVQPHLGKRMAAGVPVIGGGLETLVNTMPANRGGPTPPQQQVEQAQRNFVNAVLRRESGAVISKEEFENAAKQYFPQPGDSAEVIAQKKANRETTIKGLGDAAGSGRTNVVSAMTKGANAALIKEGREAIAKGADPAAVKQRLESKGIKDHGL